MSVIPTKTPEFVKSLFPNFVWHIDSTDNTLYLTFDDGPTPGVTEWVLDTLNAYNAKATFFCIGHNVKQAPHIYQRILDEGHTVGNHTFNHLKGWKVKTKAYMDNIALASDYIDSKLFRPPYGKLKIKQGKRLLKNGYHVVMWDVLSFDWDHNVSKEQCLANVINTSKSGSIVVFHDSIKAQRNVQYALPKTLEYFSEKGYRFKRIEV
ncbi:MAG: polysaccharide deacetylase family protein [Bacteroidota bacterium]